MSSEVTPGSLKEYVDETFENGAYEWELSNNYMIETNTRLGQIIAILQSMDQRLVMLTSDEE